jgi:predicted nucleotidyltransferase component of viral defense system
MIKDLAASVRARLLNIAKAQGVDFNQVLVRFALERILYRLSQSAHADHFLLKGALPQLAQVQAYSLYGIIR